MRKRNHTVTIRMNKEEYDLFQSKVKESGRTQQEVVIKAIADLKIATAEEIEELKRLNQMFADPLSAPGSYDKYQPDCKKTAYRWRNPKRQYVVFPQ